jgi:hypothetical protein
MTMTNNMDRGKGQEMAIHAIENGMTIIILALEKDIVNQGRGRGRHRDAKT